MTWLPSIWLQKDYVSKNWRTINPALLKSPSIKHVQKKLFRAKMDNFWRAWGLLSGLQWYNRKICGFGGGSCRVNEGKQFRKPLMGQLLSFQLLKLHKNFKTAQNCIGKIQPLFLWIAIVWPWDTLRFVDSLSYLREKEKKKTYWTGEKQNGTIHIAIFYYCYFSSFVPGFFWGNILLRTTLWKL